MAHDVLQMTFVLALGSVGGCYTGLASISDDTDGIGSGPGGDQQPSPDGDEEPQAGNPDVIEGQWRRLTRAEYRSTLVDLLGISLGASAAQDLVGGLGELESIPEAHVLYPHLDQAVGQEHVNAYVALGLEVGNAVAQDPAALEALMGACAVDGDASNDAACVEDFVEDFGALVHRRPLQGWEHAFYVDEVARVEGEVLSVEPMRVATLVAAMLNAPNFIYQVELGESEPDERAADEMFELTAWEQAARLSYRFWGTMPDAELREAARSGGLLTDEGWEAQVRRVVADRRAATHLTQSFFRRWLHLDDIPDLDNALAAPGFEEFSGDLDIGDDLRESMIDDVLASVRFHVWDEPGTYAAWLTSPHAFARENDLAAIYGTAPWDGVSVPPEPDEAERAGLLTRPAFMLHNQTRAHLIHRGAFVLEQLSCTSLGAPPPDAESEPFEPPEAPSAREYAEARTAAPACAGCHSVINPVGYALAHYDSLGRYMEEEAIFDEIEGTLLRHATVDASGTLPLAGGSHPLESAADLGEVLLDGPGQDCMAQRLAHFFTEVEQARDSQTVVAVAAALMDGTIQDALVEIAMQPNFRQKAWRH